MQIREGENRKRVPNICQTITISEVPRVSFNVARLPDHFSPPATSSDAFAGRSDVPRPYLGGLDIQAPHVLSRDYIHPSAGIEAQTYVNLYA